MDAARDDADVKLLQISGGLFDHYFAAVPAVLASEESGSSRLRFHCSRRAVENLVTMLEPFQESPQLLDPHLPRFVAPLTDALVEYLSTAVPPAAELPPVPPGECPLPIAISRLLYTLIKIRGYKVISRFLPNEPFLLEPVSSLFSTSKPIGIDESWELRYILLLWLSHLLLAPFDLSTISESSSADTATAGTSLEGTGLDVANLPSLSKRLLALGITYLSSPGNRESDAAAVLLIRISLRKDMRELGLLDAIVTWGAGVVRDPTADQSDSRRLFLKTGVLAVLAGFLAQGEPENVRKHVPTIHMLVKNMQDDDSDEWSSAGIRRLGMKVYRWVATLALAADIDLEGGEGSLEEIIERLINCLGDRDTAVRFGASKSLAVVARKLDADMAGDVLEAVMGVYDEDVFLDPPIADQGRKQRRMLSAVTPEKWHGATLTLATFLRQRAVRTTDVLQRVLACIVEALSFEQRRATFAVGGNVRDAACYAAWSLARSYTTAELEAAGDEVVILSTAFENGRTMLQILATELTVAGCLDPLGNVRRASSAALQELIGRHPDCVKEGISLVQAVDYSAVALRRRSMIDVAKHAAILDEEYWKAVAFGIIEGWRGVGSSDEDGRKLAATSLGQLVGLHYDGEDASRWKARTGDIFRILMERVLAEGTKHVEIYHGGLWALAEVLDSLRQNSSYGSPLGDQDRHALCKRIFLRLRGPEFISPIYRPELISECTSRLVRSLCHMSSELQFDAQLLRLFAAILEASLMHGKDVFLDQAVLAAHPFFSVLSLDSRKQVMDSWCERSIGTSNRHRGHILALGEVVEYVARDEHELNRVIEALLKAARRDGEVGVRVAGLKSITRTIQTQALKSAQPAQLQMIFQAITDSLDDYTIDTRGDVGSWVRAEAIEATAQCWKNGYLSHETAEDIRVDLIGKVTRLSVEKLDRVRLRSCEALVSISTYVPELNVLVKSVPPPASDEYYTSLLGLLTIPQWRTSFLEGYVTSAGAGSDSLLKSSRRAILSYLSSASFDHRRDITGSFLDAFSRADTDRIQIPMLDVLSLLLDMDLIVLTAADERRLLTLTQKSHFKTTSVPKLSGAVRLYRSLSLRATDTAVWKDTIGKLVAMLLHPFPRVREEVSQALYLVASEAGLAAVCEGMETVDFTLGTKMLMATVRDVKKLFEL